MTRADRSKRFQLTEATPVEERPQIWVEGRQQPRFKIGPFVTVSLAIARRDLVPDMLATETRLRSFGDRVRQGELSPRLDWAGRFARALPEHETVANWVLAVADVYADARARLEGKDRPAPGEEPGLAYPDLIRGTVSPAAAASARPKPARPRRAAQTAAETPEATPASPADLAPLAAPAAATPEAPLFSEPDFLAQAFQTSGAAPDAPETGLEPPPDLAPAAAPAASAPEAPLFPEPDFLAEALLATETTPKATAARARPAKARARPDEELLSFESAFLADPAPAEPATAATDPAQAAPVLQPEAQPGARRAKGRGKKSGRPMAARARNRDAVLAESPEDAARRRYFADAPLSMLGEEMPFLAPTEDATEEPTEDVTEAGESPVEAFDAQVFLTAAEAAQPTAPAVEPDLPSRATSEPEAEPGATPISAAEADPAPEAMAALAAEAFPPAVSGAEPALTPAPEAEARAEISPELAIAELFAGLTEAGEAPAARVEAAPEAPAQDPDLTAIRSAIGDLIDIALPTPTPEAEAPAPAIGAVAEAVSVAVDLSTASPEPAKPAPSIFAAISTASAEPLDPESLGDPEALARDKTALARMLSGFAELHDPEAEAEAQQDLVLEGPWGAVLQGRLPVAAPQVLPVRRRSVVGRMGGAVVRGTGGLLGGLARGLGRLSRACGRGLTGLARLLARAALGLGQGLLALARPVLRPILAWFGRSAHGAAVWALIAILMIFATPGGAFKALIYHLDGGDLSDWS